MTQKRGESSPRASRRRERSPQRSSSVRSSARLKKRMDTALAQLTQQELIRAGVEEDGGFSFKHVLVQDTAQSTLLHGEYKRLNLLVARAYEQAYAERCMDEFAAVLAQHYEAAGDDANTLKYALLAGDRAAHIYANPEAISFYTRALAAARQDNANSAQLVELYSKRGRAFELMSHYDEALENYAEMESLAQERGDRVLELAALMQRATILSTPNAKFDAAQAQELSERSLTLARELKDRASEAKILWNLMLLAHFSGRTGDAIASGEQSIALARELNLREQLAYSLNDISRPYMMNDEVERGLTSLNEAHDIWRELDNQPMLADNLNSLATTVFNLGDYPRALTLADEAFQISQSINNPWTQTHSLMTRSFIHADRGEVSQSIEMMLECLRLAQQVGFVIAVASMKNSLALTYAYIGAFDKALEWAQPILLDSEQADRWNSNSFAILALVYLMRGNLAESREMIRASYRTLEKVAPSPFLSGVTYIADVALAVAEQDLGRGFNMSDKLIDTLGGRGVRFFRFYALYLKARALDGLGRTDEAEQILRMARAEAEPIEARRNLWRILALLGEIETRRGNYQQATDLNHQAREIIEFIAAHTPDEYRESFLNLPDVRALFKP